MACELGFLQGGRTLKSWALHPMAVDNWVVRKAGGREGSELKAHTGTHMPFTTPFNHTDTGNLPHHLAQPPLNYFPSRQTWVSP